MTVRELVNRYVATKIGVKLIAKAGYKMVQIFLDENPFSGRKIGTIRISDAKLFLIKL